MHVFAWECLCPPVWLSPLRAGPNGTRRRAPNWAQMAATDRHGGGINTLINNYLNNDTGYTGGRQEDMEMRRRFEEAARERESDRDGKGSGQGGNGGGVEE